MLDFCKRIDLRTANKRVLENLIFAGACDTLPGNRAQKYEELNLIIEKAITYKKDSASGQMGLFQLAQPTNVNVTESHTFEPRAEWNNKEKLAKEKETIGFYVSAHPLDTYQKYAQLFLLNSFDDISKNNHTTQNNIALVCGSLKSKRIITTKKGERMSFLQLEDKTGNAEIIIFPKLFSKVEPFLDCYQVFMIKGEIDHGIAQQCKIKANVCVPFELLWTEWPKIEKITAKIHEPFEENTLVWLKEILPNGSIPFEFIIKENEQIVKIIPRKKISLNFDLIAQLNEKQKIDIRCFL